MFTLILIVFMNGFSENDSNAVTNIPGFTTQDQCQQAGQAASKKFSSMKRETQFVCVKVG